MTPPLRVLLVDDEELARLRLRGLVHDCIHPSGLVVGEAANVMQALAFLAENPCDLVLLDVQLPGRDGTQLAAELRQRPNAPAVVFVTAYAEHALRAFDLDAIDYLTKPVRRERLQAALERVAQRLDERRAHRRGNGGGSGDVAGEGPAALASAAAPDGATGPGETPAIVFNDRGRMLRVPLTDVLYLKAEQKYVSVRTATHTHVIEQSLNDLETRLGPRFLRVHRNALIARDAVRALERRVVEGGNTLEGGEGWAVCIAPVNEWLTVSRRQLTALREAMVATGR